MILPQKVGVLKHNVIWTLLHLALLVLSNGGNSNKKIHQYLIIYTTAQKLEVCKMYVVKKLLLYPAGMDYIYQK